jgi:hypothetical protein
MSFYTPQVFQGYTHYVPGYPIPINLNITVRCHEESTSKISQEAFSTKTTAEEVEGPKFPKKSEKKTCFERISATMKWASNRKIKLLYTALLVTTVVLASLMIGGVTFGAGGLAIKLASLSTTAASCFSAGIEHWFSHKIEKQVGAVVAAPIKKIRDYLG